jgi:hypothetical protein
MQTPKFISLFRAAAISAFNVLTASPGFAAIDLAPVLKNVTFKKV